MNIGYACLALAVPGSEMKTCSLKNANEDRLLSLIEHNLSSFETMIDYNIRNSISLFRISSDLIPFGSSSAAELPWQDIFKGKFSAIGQKIRAAGMRVSMHPGQYTVLNSTDGSVAERAAKDLDYHAEVLDCLGLGPEHKIVLHVGGAYGDKNEAAARFVSRYKALPAPVRSRLVLENDDKLFNIADVLAVADGVGIPAVYDNLHNAVNPADKSRGDVDWINCCSPTWKKDDGPQKIHYSQQHPEKKPGAHSESVQIDLFLEFCSHLSGKAVDIMLEVKDKNLSAIKCLNCISNRGINMLEAEWARYKYSVLEHSPENYHAIRKLLRDKRAYPAKEMYRMVESSLRSPVVPGNALNTAQHIWGYFKSRASETEKHRFQNILWKFSSGEAHLQTIKNNLYLMARKYHQEYLLSGYYFYI